MEKQTVGVIGTGVIAVGMAILFAGNGYPVQMLGRTKESCARGEALLSRELETLRSAGRIAPAQLTALLGRVRFTQDYGALSLCPVLFEAVNEDIEVKAAVYASLAAACPADACIASTTSALSANALAARCANPARFMVAHPWNPPYLVPLVEVVPAEQTAPAQVQRMLALLESVGRRPILLKKDIPGFIGNRLQHALFREALHLLEIGAASAEDIDAAVCYGFGKRYANIGPLECFDSADPRLHFAVESYLFPYLCNADAPQKPLVDACNSGMTAFASGKRIFDWDHDKDVGDYLRRRNELFYPYLHWEE